MDDAGLMDRRERGGGADRQSLQFDALHRAVPLDVLLERRSLDVFADDVRRRALQLGIQDPGRAERRDQTGRRNLLGEELLGLLALQAGVQLLDRHSLSQRPDAEIDNPLTARPEPAEHVVGGDRQRIPGMEIVGVTHPVSTHRGRRDSAVGFGMITLSLDPGPFAPRERPAQPPPARPPLVVPSSYRRRSRRRGAAGPPT